MAAKRFWIGCITSINGYMEHTAKLLKVEETPGGVPFVVVEEVTPANGSDFSLDELQGFVGGIIDIVTLRDGLIMVVNDEYLFNGSPFNPAASALAGEAGHVRGDVLVCPSDMVR